MDESKSVSSEQDVTNEKVIPSTKTRKLFNRETLELLNKYKDVWGTLLASSIALVSALVAFLGVVFGLYVQSATIKIQTETLKQQTELKQYEVTFKLKQEVYSSFMKQVSNVYWKALTNDLNGMNKGFDDLYTSYYSLEPFLDKEGREIVWENIQLFIMFCNDVFEKKVTNSDNSNANRTHIFYRNLFQDQIFTRLFKE
jgi:uncharacterized protein HemX